MPDHAPEPALKTSHHPLFKCALLLGVIVGAPLTASASELSRIPMTADGWRVDGDVAFAHDPVKQDIVVVTKGYAELKRGDFGNGTVEFDTKFVGSRITGITFRQHGELADALYFRPSPDCATSDECIQYMPTAYHVFEWDLYGQYQTHAPIKHDDWNHIKLVVSDGRMNVFVNGS